MSLLEKCRDLTENPTLFTMAQSIYLWNLCHSLEQLGEDRYIEKRYLDDKLACFTGHDSLGSIARMFHLTATYIPAVAYGGISIGRNSARSHIEVGGRNVGIAVKYGSLDIPLNVFAKNKNNPAFSVCTNDTQDRFAPIEFLYFSTKNAKSESTNAIASNIKESRILDRLGDSLPVFIGIGIKGITSTELSPLTTSFIQSNLNKDMRFR